MNRDAADRRFLDDVPLEILDPVGPEVYPHEPDPRDERRTDPRGRAPLGTQRPPSGYGARAAGARGYAAPAQRGPAPARRYAATRPYPAYRPAPQPAPSLYAPHTDPRAQNIYQAYPSPYQAGYPSAFPPAHPAGPHPTPGATWTAPAPATYALSAPTPARSTNVMAIIALVMSVVGMPFVGAILGYVALREIDRTGEDGRGMAQAGLWIGVAFTAIWIVSTLITGFAIGFGWLLIIAVQMSLGGVA